MSSIGPLAPLIGAAAMIGLAVATAIGLRRLPADAPPPAPSPTEPMRAALAAFAHWWPAQPDAVRAATAAPVETLLSAGAALIEALATSPDPERLLALPAVRAADTAIALDLPDTVAMLDALPGHDRATPRAIAPFASAITTIATTAETARQALQSDAITSLEIHDRYLDSKYPPNAT